jgi:hypothetical protein
MHYRPASNMFTGYGIIFKTVIKTWSMYFDHRTLHVLVSCRGEQLKHLYTPVGLLVFPTWNKIFFLAIWWRFDQNIRKHLPVSHQTMVICQYTFVWLMSLLVFSVIRGLLRSHLIGTSGRRSISSSFMEDGLLNTDSKCSAHLFKIPAFSVLTVLSHRLCFGPLPTSLSCHDNLIDYSHDWVQTALTVFSLSLC